MDQPQRCEYRKCLPLDARILEGRKQLIAHLNQIDPELTKLPSMSATHTKPCCTHPEAPKISFHGVEDHILCDVLISSCECPADHSVSKE